MSLLGTIVLLVVGCTGSGTIQIDDTSNSVDTGDSGLTDTADSGDTGDTGDTGGIDERCAEWDDVSYVTPNCGLAPLFVTADGSAIVEDNAHQDDRWHWGDGTSSELLVATKSYTEPGDYELSFDTKIDAGGTVLDVTVENIRVRVLAAE